MIALLLLLLIAPAWALDDHGKVQVKSSGTTVSSSCDFLDFVASELTAEKLGTGCRVRASTNITKCGTCVGAASCFCGTVDFRTKDVYLPLAGSGVTEPSSVVGHTRFNESRREVEVWPQAGGPLVRFPSHAPFHAVGGNQFANDFTYAGEVTSPTDCSAADTTCSRTVCRCGQCSGSNGTGTCTLRTAGTSPSNADLFGGAFSGMRASGSFQFRGFHISAGTVTGTPLSGTGTIPTGSHLILRISGLFRMESGAVLSMNARGARGGVGGACVANTAGKSGGYQQYPYTTTAFGYCLAGAGGAGGAQNNGMAGSAVSVPDIATLPWIGPFIMGVGAGGGAGPIAAANVGGNPPINWPFLQLAGCGGGGGGSVNSTCTACTPGEGGRGGGNLHIEAGQWDVDSGAVISADGETGGSGAGGGGGGFIHGMYRVLVENAGTTTVAGGSGGANCTTVYGAGAAGSAGAIWIHAVPY